MTGKMLGQFRVIEKLGAGGMGEVYKAEDTKLHRFVALKFLPAEMANSKPARERFEREARAIAGLNHPNICTLHDFGEQEGKPYLVMELLEGATLRERVQRQLPSLPQLIEWAIQMADALNFAHQRGIIHRDLKPANIFITRHNQAKILDFGLARLEAAPSEEEILAAETRSLPAQLTSPGATLGTVAYMSPEQARGEEVDARTDIFSLGVVLYEAATGKACFQAKSTAETLGQILYFNPARPSEVRSGLPAEFDRMILRALQKDPELRYQHASEIRAELKLLQRDQLAADLTPGPGRQAEFPAPGTASRQTPVGGRPAEAGSLSLPGGSDSLPAGPVSHQPAGAVPVNPSNPTPSASSAAASTRWPPEAVSQIGAHVPAGEGAPSAYSTAQASDSQIVAGLVQRHRRGLFIALSAGVVVLAAMGAWYWQNYRRQAAIRQQVHRWLYARTESLTSSGMVVPPVAVSPDGNYVAYVHRGPTGESLWLRQVNAAVGQQMIPPPAHPQSGFEYEGLTFTPDGGFLDYVAGNSIQPTLFQIPVLGGQPTRLLGDIESPVSFSPDGREMTFVRCNAQKKYSALMLAQSDGTRARVLITAQALGINGMQFLCSDLSGYSMFGPAWSPGGGRIAVGGFTFRPLQSFLIIVRTDSGKARSINLHTNFLNGMQWTPRGELLALSQNSLMSSVNHLQLLALPSARSYQLSTGITNYASLSLDHAGRLLATQNQQNFSSLWEQLPGQPARQILAPTLDNEGRFNLAWTPDGAIAFLAMTANQHTILESLNPQQSPPVSHTILTTHALLNYAIGPENRLVYEQLHHSHFQLIASNVRQPHPRILIHDGATNPIFSRHGRYIIFINLSKQLGQHLVEVPFRGGAPRVITPYFSGAYFQPALSPGGRRIVMETHNRQGRMTAMVFPLAHPQTAWYLTAHRQMQWTPDGKGISYVKAQAGADNIWVQPWGAKGKTGPARQYTHFQHQRIQSYAWSSDGKLAISRMHRLGSVVLFHAQKEK